MKILLSLLLFGFHPVMAEPPMATAQTPPNNTAVTNDYSSFSKPVQVPPKEPFKITVKVNITCDNPVKEDIFRSYIDKELRTIDDVKLVNVNPLVTINVIIMDVKNERDFSYGYVLSWAITSQVRNVLAIWAVKGNVDADTYSNLKGCLTNDGVLVDHFLFLCALDQLKNQVSQGVAKIDGGALENVRQVLKPKN